MFDLNNASAAVSAVAATAGVVVAVVAVVVAYKQLTELSVSNRQLARSNDEITASNRNLVRPVIVVDYLLTSHPSRNPQFGGSSSVSVIVKNVGVRPACNIVLQVTPPFEPAGNDADDTDVMRALDFVNRIMNGTGEIAMIDSARPVVYHLANGADAFEDDAVAKQHTVDVRYTDISGESRFHESFVLDLRAWQLAWARAEPLDRISKDIQFLADTVKSK
ncbi:hypothetical protein [Subtercola endophyticus]|uniref:hypothetical protein n=1 Tax=Subtercola endophyticus TaxID=2895559 RepID=UPI001E332ADE|nr:hypothetical protein [Subtercola endophyticus]UFS57637.1 hypothetical protein LQ955_11255 [Subtercola endophyticus]